MRSGNGQHDIAVLSDCSPGMGAGAAKVEHAIETIVATATETASNRIFILLVL